MFLSLILPALSILIFFVGNGNLSHSHSSDKSTNQIPSELKGLGHCDTFFEDGCFQIAFTPLTSWTEKVMKQVATYNGLNYDSNSIQGFSTTGGLKVSIASCDQISIFPFLTIPSVFCSIKSWQSSIFRVFL